jgi:hypothetical protein
MNRYRSVELDDGYVAHFFWESDDRMRVQLSYDSTFVAETRTGSHLWAARWARRQMRKHQRAMRILKGEH